MAKKHNGRIQVREFSMNQQSDISFALGRAQEALAELKPGVERIILVVERTPRQKTLGTRTRKSTIGEIYIDDEIDLAITARQVTAEFCKTDLQKNRLVLIIVSEPIYTYPQKKDAI